MLLELTNSPAAFQQFMNNIFHDLLDKYVTIYLDDILIYSDSPAKHWKHVCEVFCHLRQHSLYARANKCKFSIDTIEYLGYIDWSLHVQEESPDYPELA